MILQKHFPPFPEWQHQFAHSLERPPAIGCAQFDYRVLKMLATIGESETRIRTKQCPNKAKVFLAQPFDRRFNRLPGSSTPLTRPWIQAVRLTGRANLKSVRR